MDTPVFPIRILFDDGEVVELDSPDALMAEIDTIDSDELRLWVRDALDRDVTLRMRYGTVETFALRGSG
jgi:hypothetical protein